MRIIINVGLGVSREEAIRYVTQVIDQGEISEAAGIKHFCWHTGWKNGIHVVANRKKTAKSADSFTVFVRPPQ